MAEKIFNRREFLKIAGAALAGAGVAALIPEVRAELSPLNKAMTIEPTRGRTPDQFDKDHIDKSHWWNLQRQIEGTDINIWKQDFYSLKVGLFQNRDGVPVVRAALYDLTAGEGTLEKEFNVISKILPDGTAKIRFREKLLPAKMQNPNIPKRMWDIEYFESNINGRVEYSARIADIVDKPEG